MSLSDTLRLVVRALDQAGVPFMVAGSIASGFHGETRSTQDVDMVVDPDAAGALDRFVSLLDRDRFYVGDHRTAFDRRDMFNIVDITNGWKFDLIIRHDRPFSREEFARRQPATLDGVDVHVVSAEDVVLSKLEWARLGGSERQLEDVRAVVRTSGGSLDRPYLELWAEQLDVADALAAILSDDR